MKKFWKRSEGDENVAVSHVKKSHRMFKIKVRLYGPEHKVRKFAVFVEPKHDVMEDTEEKIAGLFKDDAGLRIKVRLFDGHGAGQVRKFKVFAPAQDNMDNVQEKIKRLFGGSS